MVNNKKSRLKLFINKNPLLYSVLTCLLSCIFGYYISYFTDLKPSIYRIELASDSILNSQINTLSIIRDINDKYTSTLEEGIEIKIGYSSELKGDLIKVIKNEQFDLKRGEEIIISDNVRRYKTSIRLMVDEVILDKQKNLEQNVFIIVSKDAIYRLGLEDEIHKGIFTVKMKHTIK
jgi:hypothetical protein